MFEVALLGDKLLQLTQQRIHITQRPRDGALFGDGRERNSECVKIVSIDAGTPLLPLYEWKSIVLRTY